MAWTESGFFAAQLAASAGGGTVNWDATTNKFFLTTNSDTPAYAVALASAIYATTYEVTGTAWAAGGVAVSALGAGPSSIAPTLTVTGPGPSKMVWGASNISVAATTISTPVFGGYFYSTAVSNYLIAGIYFGGSGYTTTAGTFGISWSGGVIATITGAA